jgi:hypothetical protein
MTFTLRNAPQFPIGTEVRVRTPSVHRRGRRPAGTDAADPQVMTSDGAHFTGLRPGRRYLAYAEVGGRHRYVFFALRGFPYTSLTGH